MKIISSRPAGEVTGGARGLVNHVGARLVAEAADVTGLTSGLSAAMASTRRRSGGHDRGRVLADVAVMLADGGRFISDLAVLRDQPEVFGGVASTPTAWRTLGAVGDGEREAIARARAEARRVAWEAGTDPGFYVIDLDGTLINAHSDKQGAAGNYKGGFGFHPIVAFLDGTGEALAGKLRPGNAGSQHAGDHVEVLDAALAQLPVDPAEVEVIARVDTAGCSHEFVNGCRERQVRFAVGHPLTQDLANILINVPKRRWRLAISADGTEVCEGREIAEVTDLVDLSGWPTGTRMIVRREDPHPGAQLTFTDIEGRRYQAFITDHADSDIGFLEAMHRGRGRCEQHIANAKDTGLASMPSASFPINQAWLECVLIAHDLLAWTRSLGLDDELATAAPKRLRYTLFHVAGQITRSGRRTRIRLADNWAWTNQLIEAFTRIRNIPLQI